jgi:hypothetical protein
MSFNKKYLPTKEELITILLECGSDDFYRGYVKTVDAYIGSVESMEFMDKFVDKWISADKEFNELG